MAKKRNPQPEHIDQIEVLNGTGKMRLYRFKDSRDPKEIEKWRQREKGAESLGVLVIYTGGTIGSAPQDDEDPDSPQVVFGWEDLLKFTPSLEGVGGGKINFRVDAISFADPLDSANVGPREWSAMARIIEREQHNYEGFVIAHGTDTLVYSASALSFVLHRLKRPVILTGAQLSLVEKARNDGLQNLITAIMIANPTFYRRGKPEDFGEVCVFFGQELLRGNRTKKIDAEGFAAFKSPNYDPLGVAGSQIHIYPERFFKSDDPRALEVRDILDTRVVALDIFPGIQSTQLIGEICKLKDESGVPQVRGLVLKTYGTGNVPNIDPLNVPSKTDESGFLKQIENAIKNEIAVINVTQCQKGGVEMGLYETSAVLDRIGVCSGEDITSEAALCKMMVLLGSVKEGEFLDYPKILDRLRVDWAGEQSYSLRTVKVAERKDLMKDQKNPRRQIVLWDRERFSPNRVARAVLKIHGAKLTGEPTRRQDGELPRVDITVWVGARATVPSDFDDASRCAGPFAKEQTAVPMTMMFDVTEAAKKHLSVGGRVPITIEVGGMSAQFDWSTVELAFHERSGRVE